MRIEGLKPDGKTEATLPVAADGLSIPVSGILTAVIDESTLATSAKQDTGNTSLTSIDGKISAAAAAGDTDANPTVGGIRAFLEVFNGTNWQRVRNGITAISATLTGMLNTLPWAVFHITPTTRTDGQGGPLEADASGNLQVNLATRVAGENISADRLAVEGEWTYATITTATTTTLKSGAGVLHSVTVCKAIAAATIDGYDNIVGSGVKIIPAITYGAAILTDPPLGGQPLDVQFSNGLTFVTSAATFIVVAYR
jgi:hypothetical protein